MTLPEKTRSDHVEWIMNSDFGTVVENDIDSESPMKVQTQKSNSELEPEKVENDQVIEQNNNSDNQDLTEEIENEQIFEQNNKQKRKVKRARFGPGSGQVRARFRPCLYRNVK